MRSGIQPPKHKLKCLIMSFADALVASTPEEKNARMQRNKKHEVQDPEEGKAGKKDDHHPIYL